MIDDFKGNIISAFVGLKSKMYWLVSVDNKEIKKAKGVNKNVITNIRHRVIAYRVIASGYSFCYKVVCPK